MTTLTFGGVTITAKNYVTDCVSDSLKDYIFL